MVRGTTWYLRNGDTSGVANVSFGYGSAFDIGLSTASTLIRDRGGPPLSPSLAGRNVTVLPTGNHVVALTFDAGANAAGLPKIFSALQGACVPATFNLTGAWTHTFALPDR